MKFLIVGTAGHIDHGKSSLIRSLTGTDPDRLKEEKERGITIDLGFAHMDLGETQIGFVDVPGHERFVRNMLAGAGGMDAVLFVVAADESVMPQTREHLDICHLLGIDQGIFVVTKTDMVDCAMLPLVAEEISEITRGTALQDFPVVFVSNTTGQGMEDVRKALGDLVERATSRVTHQMPRLPIDRVFTLRGFGTVVTGTLYSGRLQREQPVQILPGGLMPRIRGLQTYGRGSDTATEGQRTAVNLQGVEKKELSRGMTLILPGAMQTTQCMDAHLSLVSSAGKALHTGEVVRLHVGTQETLCRVILLGTDSLEPGQSALVQFRTRSPLAVWMGDRLIIRRVSPAATLGGGEILNPAARKRRRRTQDLEAVQRLLKRQGIGRVGEFVLTEGYASEATLTSLSGYPAEYLSRQLQKDPLLVSIGTAPRCCCSREFLQGMSRRLFETVENFQKSNRLAPGMKKEELRSKLPPTLPPDIFQYLLDMLRQEGKATVGGEFVSVSGKDVSLPLEDQKLFDRLEQLLAQSGVQPPSVKDLLQRAGADEKRGRNVLFLLQQRNIAVKIAEDVWMHHTHLEQIQSRLRRRFPPGAQFNVGQFKDLLGISRKYAIPFLEYFDRQRITRRTGDMRQVL
ncbi:MAG: selenocysteine-specific translation elongation factor [Acidobacteria bacterium]|nr:selenocysteine-specific translation elongation factor [Acidobacteriota bacterium]